MKAVDGVEPAAEQPADAIEAQTEPAVVAAQKPPKIKLPSASAFLADKLAEAKSIESSIFSLTDHPGSAKALPDLNLGGEW